MKAPWATLESLAQGVREVVVAAPYMKQDALERLLALLPHGATITCITRWQRHDIAVGASDIGCRAMVKSFGGTFLLHPRLHAKYYRLGQRTLIGSANLTSRGMGYVSPSNAEILCEPSPGFDSIRFEQFLLRDARRIDDSELARWEAVQGLPRLEGDRSVKPGQGREWWPATRDPENVWLAYTGSAEQIISPDELRMAEQDLTVLDLPGGLDRGAFGVWIAADLLSSAAVNDVRRTESLSESDAWTSLSDAWGVSKSDAQRFRETAQNWIAMFLPHMGFFPPH